MWDACVGSSGEPVDDGDGAADVVWFDVGTQTRRIRVATRSSQTVSNDADVAARVNLLQEELREWAQWYELALSTREVQAATPARAHEW